MDVCKLSNAKAQSRIESVLSYLSHACLKSTSFGSLVALFYPHPLIPEEAIPSTKYFCNDRKTIKVGITAIHAAARAGP